MCDDSSFSASCDTSASTSCDTSASTSCDTTSSTTCDVSSSSYCDNSTSYDSSTNSSFNNFWTDTSVLPTSSSQFHHDSLFGSSNESSNDKRKKNGTNVKYVRSIIPAKTIIYIPGISENIPTVIPGHFFNPMDDAKDLHAALKSFFTKQSTIVNIICNKPIEQRKIIDDTYFDLFGRHLIEDIRSKTHGNFKELLSALLTPITNIYVKDLKSALAENRQTYVDLLVEMLCSCSNRQINEIKRIYTKIYGKNLEGELKTSIPFKHLLGLSRDKSSTVEDYHGVNRDVRMLLGALEKSYPPDQITVADILGQRSFSHIKLIFEQYEYIAGYSLEISIRKHCDGDFARGLIAILQYAVCKAVFFATRLNKSIIFNEKSSIRLFVTRCEIDLNDIKMAYQRIYGRNLRSLIKKNSSGDYKHALYSLIGETCSKPQYQ